MQPEGVQFSEFLLAMFLYFIFELNSLSIEVIRGYVFLGLGHSWNLTWFDSFIDGIFVYFLLLVWFPLLVDGLGVAVLLFEGLEFFSDFGQYFLFDGVGANGWLDYLWFLLAVVRGELGRKTV